MDVVENKGFEIRTSEVQTLDLSLTSYITRQILESLSLSFLAIKLYTNNLAVLLKGLNEILAIRYVMPGIEQDLNKSMFLDLPELSSWKNSFTFQVVWITELLTEILGRL